MPWVSDNTFENFGEFIRRITEFQNMYGMPEVKSFKNIKSICEEFYKFIMLETVEELKSKHKDPGVYFAQLSGAMSIQIAQALVAVGEKLHDLKAKKKAYKRFLEKELYLVDAFRKLTEGCSKSDINLATFFETQCEQLKTHTLQVVNRIFSEIKSESQESEADEKLKLLLDKFETKFRNDMKAFEAKHKEVANSRVTKLTASFQAVDVASQIKSLSEIKQGTRLQELEIKFERMKAMSIAEDLKLKESDKTSPLESDLVTEEKKEILKVSEILDSKQIDEQKIKDDLAVSLQENERLQSELATLREEQKEERKATAVQTNTNPSFFKYAFQFCTKTMTSGASTLTLGIGYLGLSYLSKYYGEMMDELIHADDTGINHQMVIAGTLILSGVGICSAGLVRSRRAHSQPIRESVIENGEQSTETTSFLESKSSSIQRYSYL